VNLTQLVIADRRSPTSDPSLTAGPGGGAEGNSRLTGVAGAALFVILAVEGVTLLQIRQLITLHVFVGLLLVPLVLLKTGSTTYRFTRYYTGDAAYSRQGPPPVVLRVTGPLLVASTLALLGTGLLLVALGRSVGHQYRWLHQTTFFVWAALLAVHVLGHLRETVALTADDGRAWLGRGEPEHRVAGARARLSLLVVTVAVGLALGVASIDWVGTWHHVRHLGHG
jgi:hypothetical protein